MPRYCRVKAEAFSDNPSVSGTYRGICESVIPLFGIDPGSDDEDTSWFAWAFDVILVIIDPKSCWFQILIMFIVTGIAFMLGVYLRRRTILGLLRQKEEWADKEKMLLNQLWAALEEKLDAKSMAQELQSSVDKVKIELDGEKSEKESLQARLWGMERNIKILQTERDVLEEKLRDCISTFADLRKNIGKNSGSGETVGIANCMDKIKSLQVLLQKLIEAHRQEHLNFISMLEKQPSV